MMLAVRFYFESHATVYQKSLAVARSRILALVIYEEMCELPTLIFEAVF